MRILYLGNNHLSGPIPSSIINLSSLQEIDLSQNQLFGEIPKAIGNVSSLRILYLDNNKLSGFLPPSIFNLYSLEKVDISDNQLSGSIPSIQHNMSYLQIIDFRANYLTGHLPSNLFDYLPKLQGLYLDQNQISGSIPTSLFKSKELEILSMFGNHLESIPEMGNLTMLQNLFLSENNIRGSIPSSIFNISSLQDIELSKNQLSGSIPPMFSTSSSLQVVILNNNKLSGFLPFTAFNISSQLQLIDFSTNNLTGPIPSNMFDNFPKLQWLSLSWNQLSGKIPVGLFKCQELGVLSLSLNHLEGPLPVEIGNLTSLRSLVLGFNNLKGEIPRQIGELLNLEFLYLNNGKHIGRIPSVIGNLTLLRVLDLSSNNMTGSIPVEIGNLGSLEELKLGINSFSGTVPHTIFNSSIMKTISLPLNLLSGGLPSATALWLPNIELFELGANKISGSIPFSITNASRLIKLDLGSNLFSRSIPDTLGNLRDLQVLSLERTRRNCLSGTIPKSLEKLLNLKYFNVSFNRLQGEIPDGGTFSNYSIQSFIGNKALCGAPWLQLIPPCKTNAYRRSNKTAKLLEYILPAVFSTTILILIMIIIFSRSRKRKASLPTQGNIIPLATWRRISYQELQQATDGFCENNLLGKGSFGSVYYGALLDGTSIAVKVFNLEVEGAFKSFDVECEVLRNICHKNLVKIITSCCNIDFKALVLEFMTNGSLEKWLHSHNHFLDMLQRLNIMIDVASALEYLHHGLATPVVHCDLKPNNVLLDEGMSAHLGDFGIAKLLGEEDSLIQTMTLATIGYMAPEYGGEGIVSIRGDVYSFGILLMETFTGKKPTNEMFSGEMSLKYWVKQSLPTALLQLIDANLLSNNDRSRESSVAKDCAMSVLELAGECTAELPEERIGMKEVVVKLKKIKIKFLERS